MGFKSWYEALIFIFLLGSLVLVPCGFIAVIGSNMINALGNFPTKSAKVQAKSCLIVLGIWLLSALGFYIFYVIFL